MEKLNAIGDGDDDDDDEDDKTPEINMSA